MAICGDVPLRRGEWLRYIAAGLADLWRGIRQPTRTRSWRIDLSSAEACVKIREGASPWRTYTSAFLAEACASLPDGGLVVDLGCGRAAQARFFNAVPKARYVGIDILEATTWRTAGGQGVRSSFVLTSAERIGIRDAVADMVISSSTLEHVHDHRAAIREASRVTRAGGCGIHLVPGIWSLLLFGPHGYRRFSAADVLREFNGERESVVDVWALGGLASFSLHAIAIAALRDRGRGGPVTHAYRAALRVALVLDRWLPIVPAGYAVVILRR